MRIYRLSNQASTIISICTLVVLFIVFYGNNGITDTSNNVQNNYSERLASQERVIEIMAGGDVSFDLKVRKPRVVLKDYPRSVFDKIKDKIYYGRSKIVGARFPEVILGESVDELSWWEKENWQSFNYTFSDLKEELEYPFKNISSLLEEADIAMINLETPIADENKSRIIGYFVSNPYFAYSLKEHGVDLVSVANNHAWDAGERGFLQTLENLDQAKIRIIGGGRDIAEAREPEIIEVDNTKIGFLGYSQQFKYKFISVADNFNPGIAPLNLNIISEDIQYTKKYSDIVVISLHWGMENTSDVHPEARNMAYRILDAGADIIIGHHSHVPKGIEIYNGKPILYSLGNFIFGHNVPWWDDNILARILVRNKKIINIEILPISGKGQKLYQPALLEGKEAAKLLEKIKAMSHELNTNMDIVGNKGIIKVNEY